MATQEQQTSIASQAKGAERLLGLLTVNGTGFNKLRVAQQFVEHLKMLVEQHGADRTAKYKQAGQAEGAAELIRHLDGHQGIGRVTVQKARRLAEENELIKAGSVHITADDRHPEESSQFGDAGNTLHRSNVNNDSVG